MKTYIGKPSSGLEPVSATILRGQNCHFWAKIRVFWPPTAILTPKSVLCPNFFLALDFLGYDLLIICLGRFLSPKKGPLEHFENGYFGPKFRFWSRFGPLDPFFHQSCPPNALIWCLAMLWAPIGTLIGVLGCKTGLP